MGVETGIAWCDHTFSPWWGCQRVSPGCENCYAESFAKRVGHGKRLPMIWGPASTTERRFFGDAHWNEPKKWNAKAARDGVRRRVFCASMADVFEDRDDLLRERSRLGDLIEATPHLDWLLLTKRPENMARLARRDMWTTQEWPSNVWAGCTVEDQKRADERIPHLLVVPARVLFLSCEPLLEAVTIPQWALTKVSELIRFEAFTKEAKRAYPVQPARLVAHGIDWIIVGGESGVGARPFDTAWARSIIRQCALSSAKCFTKQLGSKPYRACVKEYCGTDREWLSLRDSKGGDWDRWPADEQDLRVREWPMVMP